MRKSARGFTLIELLVTISIIAVLAAIGLVAYSSVMKQGRDAKRQSDLRSIQSALNQYFIDQNSYPQIITFGGSLFAGVKTYLNVIPNDPMGGTWSYIYSPIPTSCSGNNCTSYCLYAYWENSSPGLPTPAACGAIAHWFVVTPP